jgi:excisionase family DNA binding protein
MDNEYLTTGEVARELGYSIPWVRSQIDAGRLRAECYRVGPRRSIRVRAADVRRFRELYMRAA